MRQPPSSASAPAGNTTLDPAVIALFRQRRPGFLERIATAYLEEAPKYLRNLKAASTVEDYDAMKMAAHTLKSSSANIGAVRLSEVCQEIENTVSSKDMKALTALLGSVGGEYFAVEEALKQVLYEVKKNAGS
jgi:HPt (histidine-containing phosphotransfer) domain-containing protein